MKRCIIAAAALLLFAGVSLAANPWPSVGLDRIFSSALGRLDLGAGIGQLLLAGSPPVMTAGHRRGHYRPPERRRERGRQHSEGPEWRSRRPHYHGSFLRWLFGRCWCQRGAPPGRGHGGRPEGGRGGKRGHGGGHGHR
jgi:hypothetical protein